MPMELNLRFWSHWNIAVRAEFDFGAMTGICRRAAEYGRHARSGSPVGIVPVKRP
jgi:hypothetical protein